ncbi:hypothetical protein JT092_06825 [Helicobacter pylori]|nr:hypothetical protein [Helicobacter pylori]
MHANNVVYSRHSKDRFILFGKKKDVKEDSKFHKTIMNIVFTIAVVIVLCPWILMVLFYPIMYLLLHVIPS